MQCREENNTVGCFSPFKRCAGHSMRLAGKCLHVIACLLTPYASQCSTQLEPLYRMIARYIAFSLYRIHAVGFEKIPEKGAVLLVSNHVSYVDGLIINALCKRKIRYVIEYSIYKMPVIHYFMKLNRAIPISSNKEHIAQALEAISAGLKAGDAICIFPEGRMTYNGFISHFRPGVEWIIHRDPTPIYPIVLEGLWGSIFSRKYRGSFWRFFPRQLRRNVSAICGDVLYPEEVSIDRLHLVMLGLRRRVMR